MIQQLRFCLSNPENRKQGLGRTRAHPRSRSIVPHDQKVEATPVSVMDEQDVVDPYNEILTIQP